jgi:glutaconate CoA-transferase subunit B
MQVFSLHPGVALQQVQSATGFALEVAGDLGTTAAPTADELRILREEVDPHRYILGRGE